jgi:hypothetical protein
MKTTKTGGKWRSRFRKSVIFLGALAIMGEAAHLYFREDLLKSRTLEDARLIGGALVEYAVDHDGKYPDGKSSTEVFQKLIDEQYLLNSDDGENLANPSLLYFPMPGKVKATTKQLKPENVCWDVTLGIDNNSPDRLPTIFLTGYKITYAPGVRAIPLPGPARSWVDWWNGVPAQPRPFSVVAYKDNYKVVLKADPDGSIPNIIPADFDTKGATYRQLTPDGTMSP